MSQITIRKVIAGRLKDARIAAGYVSQEEFCQANQLNLNIYCVHENGKSTMRASQIMRYCDMLHVTLQWVMLGDILEKKDDIG